MRFYFFIFLVVFFAGCQSQGRQSEATRIPPSNALSTHSPTLTPSRSMPTSTATLVTPTKAATPTQTATETVEPVVTQTSDLQPVDPVQPVPIPVVTAYPDTQSFETIEPVWRYQIVNEYPHDTSAYTQGLVVNDDLQTYPEGTRRDSSLRRVDLQTGAIELYKALPDQYFGEGITNFANKIFQLTWKSQVGFIYDAENLEQIGEFYYPHKGWGLTHDGSNLIVSDGTNVIRFRDPKTSQEVRRMRGCGVMAP